MRTRDAHSGLDNLGEFSPQPHKLFLYCLRITYQSMSRYLVQNSHNSQPILSLSCQFVRSIICVVPKYHVQLKRQITINKLCNATSGAVTRVFRGILKVVTRSLPKIAEDNQAFSNTSESRTCPLEDLQISTEHFQRFSKGKEYQRKVLQSSENQSKTTEDFSTLSQALRIFSERFGHVLEG